MPPIRFLTAPQLRLLYARAVLPALPTQPTMLESAVDSPRQHHHYLGQEDPFQLAAILAQKVMKNHSFQDGNKRAALVAADAFLRLNGWKLSDRRLDTGGLKDWDVGIASSSRETRDLGMFYEAVAVKT